MRVLALVISLAGCGLPPADAKLLDVRPDQWERLCETAFDDTVYHCDGSGSDARADGVTDYRIEALGCTQLRSAKTCQETVADFQTCADAQRALIESDPCDLESVPDECAAIGVDCRVGFSFVEPSPTNGG